MGLMKVFSGSEILALALQEKLETAGIDTVKKIIFNRLVWVDLVVPIWPLKFLFKKQILLRRIQLSRILE